MNTEKWRRLSRLMTRRSEILKLWGRSLAENLILEYEMAQINKEIKELHKMYAERCEQVNRLTRDNELLKNKDKCKWHI